MQRYLCLSREEFRSGMERAVSVVVKLNVEIAKEGPGRCLLRNQDPVCIWTGVSVDLDLGVIPTP